MLFYSVCECGIDVSIFFFSFVLFSYGKIYYQISLTALTSAEMNYFNSIYLIVLRDLLIPECGIWVYVWEVEDCRKINDTERETNKKKRTFYEVKINYD